MEARDLIARIVEASVRLRQQRPQGGDGNRSRRRDALKPSRGRLAGLPCESQVRQPLLGRLERRGTPRGRVG